ncbi:MAG: hypothetical protein EA426_00310 [Spirochaetaceae bacterium]|nr:MAG: hypothetical protein EA426_00310 [Spirochaetaceae bacterium]
MAVKTITIDMEAYELLASARRSNESFSTVIKTILVPAGNTAAALLHHLDGVTVDDEYLDAMERVLAARGDDLIAAENASNYAAAEKQDTDAP